MESLGAAHARPEFWGEFSQLAVAIVKERSLHKDDSWSLSMKGRGDRTLQKNKTKARANLHTAGYLCVLLAAVAQRRHMAQFAMRSTSLFALKVCLSS